MFSSLIPSSLNFFIFPPQIIFSVPTTVKMCVYVGVCLCMRCVYSCSQGAFSLGVNIKLLNTLKFYPYPAYEISDYKILRSRCQATQDISHR